MNATMKAVINRLYGDYLMPSRLSYYEQNIVLAKERGYKLVPIKDFYLSSQNSDNASSFLICRHDIDTDLHTTRKIFEIEKKHNVRSTFYFRLSTLDYKLMREIDEYGSEVGYHYEEIASYAKKYRIKDADSILSKIEEIRDEFIVNFHSVEKEFSRKIFSVASHGDFANRLLKVPNHRILNSSRVREACQITLEAYDDSLINKLDVYIADRSYPEYYFPISLEHALGKYQKILFLTHPRNWETNWGANTKDNAVRVFEGLTY